MLSYTGRRNLFGTLTQNTTSTNLTTGDTLMNAAEKRILSGHEFPFLERTDTATATTQFTQIPQRIGKLITLKVSDGTTTYNPKEVTNEKDWNELTATSVTSNAIQYWYERNGQVGLFPTPSSVTITFFGRAVPKDLTAADYTTGGILTATNGSTSIVGTGTTFTASMVGRFLRITESDTANKGDGFWYEIASYSSGTAITLSKPYAGTSISGGNAAYTIGQMSLLPEGFTELPVYDAVKTYFASIQPDYSKFQFYDKMYKEMEQRLLMDYAVKPEAFGLGADIPDYE